MKTNALQDDMDTVYVGMAALLIAAVCAAWYFYHPYITYWLLKWGWLQLQGAAVFLPRSMLDMLQADVIGAASNPSVVSPGSLLSLLNRIGWHFVWVPVAVSGYGVMKAQTHRDHRSRRGITAATLPHIMSRHSPAVVPVLYYGDLLNTDPEEHKRALNPEEWVRQHGLVVNRQLQRAACKAILAADLGQKIDTLAALSPTERAMFAVMGARLLSAGRDTAQSQLLLDQLNRSCQSGRFNGRCGYPDLSICDAAFALYAAHPDVPSLIARHPYPRTLLHAMHLRALRFGKLPSSHFRWLKGMDRPLWYALNTTGRKAPFIESAAVFTQAMWEDFASDQGFVLTEPCLEGAVDGIELYLRKIGIVNS